MLVRVMFVRAADSYRMMPQFGAVPVPGLLYYERGCLTGAAPLHTFGDAFCIQETQVDRWLMKKLAASSTEQSASLQNNSDDSQVRFLHIAEALLCWYHCYLSVSTCSKLSGIVMFASSQD